MALIDIDRKPEQLQAYQLTDPQGVIDTLQYILWAGYAGNINCATSSPGQAVWTMWIQHPAQSTSMSASIGDWVIIRNNATAEIVSDTQFQQLYQHTEN